MEVLNFSTIWKLVRMPSPWHLPWADLASCVAADSCSSEVMVWQGSALLLTCPYSVQEMPSDRVSWQGKQLEQDPKNSRQFFYPIPLWFQRELFSVARLVLSGLQYKPTRKPMWFSKWLCHTSNVLDETDGLGIDGPNVLEACKRSVHIFYGP